MKCPWCEKEVPIEEYSRHYETCPARLKHHLREEGGLYHAKSEEMQPVGEEIRLGATVPISQICDYLLQLSRMQAVYALEAVRHFTAPQPAGLPPYTKELFERHIEDATTRLGVILDIASRINCPNIEKIKHNARIVFEIRKKYLGLGYRLE